MAKKTPEEIFREAQRKAQEMYGAVQDPQFQQDVTANAQALAKQAGQAGMNAGNKLGNAMEGFSMPTQYNGQLGGQPGPIVGADQINSLVNQAGTGLRQGIYDLRTGGQPAAPYPDANNAMGAITGQAASDIYRAGHPSPYGMNLSDGPYIEQAKSILQQAGQQINENTVMPLVEELKMRAKQMQKQIEQLPQKGLDWARGLLQ